MGQKGEVRSTTDGQRNGSNGREQRQKEEQGVSSQGEMTGTCWGVICCSGEGWLKSCGSGP